MKLADVNTLVPKTTPLDTSVLQYPEGVNFTQTLYEFRLKAVRTGGFNVILYSLKNPEQEKVFFFADSALLSGVMQHMSSLTDTQIKDLLKDK